METNSEIIFAINAISEKIKEELKGIGEKLNETMGWVTANSITLSKYGWYLSDKMSIVLWRDVFIAIHKNKTETLDKILMRYYRKNTNRIKSVLLEKFPERKEVISEMFMAQKKKMYFSSTLLFLSQADGICEGKLFKLSKNKKEFNELLKTVNTNSILISTLGKKSAIDAWTGEKSNYFSELNRHEVMHGLYNSYGNEINSLKALSLLCFISDFYKKP